MFIPDISSQLSSIVLLLWLVSELLREVGGVENEVIELLREIEGEGIETQGDSSLLNLVAFGLVVSKFESDNFLAVGLLIPQLESDIFLADGCVTFMLGSDIFLPGKDFFSGLDFLKKS